MSPHPVDIHVGKRLRLKRTFLGLSQEALGNAIGITFQQIQKYERGINRMGASRLFEFAKVMAVPVSYFFESFGEEALSGSGEIAFGMSESEVQGFEHEQLSSRETLEMMRAYYRIKDVNLRRKIFELTKSLAETESDDLSPKKTKTIL